MPNFLYFLPNTLRQELTRDKIAAAGLGDVLRDRLSQDDLANKGRLAIADVIHGPDGSQGTILYPLPTTPHEEEANGIGYYPATQQWQHVPVVNSPGYWLGWDPSNLPGPDDIERESLILGYSELLCDGNLWECPTIRLKHGRVNLPDVWGLDHGKCVSRVKPDWKWAWDLSGQIWDQLVSGDDPGQQVAYQWCAQLLSINYRVGPVEISILGLLGVAEASAILRASIAGALIDKIRDEQKKTNTPGTDVALTYSPGSEAAIPATAPAEATSI